MTTPISIVGLTKRFAGATANAVDGVSLEVGVGQLFFLLGPSGCGKTTLLRMIAGFTEPTSGSIRFGPREVTRLAPEKRNTGMVFQSYALWPHMTVAQNVEFGLKARKVAREDRRRRVGEALELVQMGPYASRKPGQLSGGQQQRVALARALVVKPDVLLLDEPLSNLDAKLRHEMRHEIKRVCDATGITTVYVTHDQKEALSMADVLAVMSAGRALQVGGPREVYERPSSRFVADFLGPTNFLDGTVVERRAVEGGHETVVETQAGRLVSRSGGGGSGPSSGRVTCLIRPESLRVVEGAGAGSVNVLRGAHVESMYLGEMSQRWVSAPGAVSSNGSGEESGRIKFFELNPQREYGPGEPLSLTVSPRDVAILPA